MNINCMTNKKNHLSKRLLGLGITLLITACSHPPISTQSDKCVKEGFFRSTVIVGNYYKCVWSPVHNIFLKYIFSCPAGQEFNEQSQRCE